MKRTLKILAIVVIGVPLLGFGWLWYSTGKNRAIPTEDALVALATDATVIVDAGDWLVMRPGASEPAVGLIVYPGAHCDIRGYAPVLREIAARGYLVVGVSMPFDFSIFAPNRADEVRDAFPQIRQWVIAGHSMGGAMASRYAFGHQRDLAGLILWDSYPPESNSLADSRLPIVHIHRATLDGEPPQKFIEQMHLFPAASRWVPISGGNHMYFGSFIGGAYEEEWEAVIGREEQQAISLAATLDALASMTEQ